MTSAAATLIANIISIFILNELFSSIYFATVGTMILFAIILGIVNMFVKPILKFLSLPFTILTLGIFSLVVNALVLMLAFKLTPNASIASFGSAFLASIVLGIINSFVIKLFEK